MSLDAELDVSTPAVVLKFDPNVLHHGGLGVIRSLGRFGVPVHGMHEDAWAPAAHSRYLRGRWVWRPDDADPRAVLSVLRRLSDRIGRRAVVLPTDDAGAVFLAEHADLLRENFLFSAPDPALVRDLASKDGVRRRCRAAGLPEPDSVWASTWSAVADFRARHGLPLVVKRARSWSCGRSTAVRSTTIVRDDGELAALFAAVRAAGDPGVIVQEHLTAGEDWFFHGYRGRDGCCHPALTGRKDRSYPAYAGLTSFGRAVDNPELRARVTELLTSLDYRGVVDLDLRWDARTGSYRLLDFNPRLGAQFRLFHDSAGIDVARAAYLDLTGQPVPRGTVPDGRSFVVENYDPVAALRYWRDGELRRDEWTRSVLAADERAWWSRDDPLPFLLMCLRMGWRAASRWARHRGSGQVIRPRGAETEVLVDGMGQGRTKELVGEET